MDARELQRLQQVYSTVAGSTATTTPTPKKKSFWVDNISTAGGILGGIAGIPLGIVGAGAGAAGGSALGQALENMIAGDDLGKDVVKEGMMGGVLGIGPGRLVKGGLALKGGGKVAQIGNNLERSVANTGKVSKTFTDEQRIMETLNRRGLTGSGQKLYRNADTELATISKEIDDLLAQSTKTTARKPLINSLRKSVEDAVPADPTFTKELTRALSRIEKSTSGTIDARELFTLKREVSNRLGNAFTKVQKGNPLTAKEEVDMALWKQLDGAISKINPKVKNLTLDQSNIIQARPGFKASSEKSAGIPLLGIKSTGIEQKLQSAKGAMGRSMSGATNVKPMNARGITGRLGAYGALSAMGSEGMQEQPATLEDAMIGASEMGGVPQQQSPISFEDALAAMQEDLAATGGKNMDKIEKLYKFANSNSAGGGNLNSTASGVIADTKTGLKSLQGLSGNITASNANSPGIGQLRALNPFDTNAQNLQANIATAKQIVGKALEGGVLRKEDEYKYAKILPKMGDTDEVAQYKIAQLIELISNRLNEYQYNIKGGSGVSLEDALMNVQ